MIEEEISLIWETLYYYVLEKIEGLIFWLDPITGSRERERRRLKRSFKEKWKEQFLTSNFWPQTTKMEAAGNGSGGGEPQLLISGVGGDQPLVMSAEDAAQFLAQAGLQLADVTDSGEQVIINSGGLENAGLVKV